MDKSRVLCILFALAVAIGASTVVSYASLISTSFGFPVITQAGTTTAFNQDTASATDLESLNINFPTLSDGQGLSSTGITSVPSSIGSMGMFTSPAMSSLTSMFGGSSFFSLL